MPYPKLANNLTLFCALLVTYYAFSYFLSPVPEGPPGSSYIAMCIVLMHIVNSRLGFLASMPDMRSRLSLTLTALAAACVILLLALQAYYVVAWLYSMFDDELIISYQRLKELVLATHVSLTIVLCGLLFGATHPTARYKRPSRYDYGLLLLSLLPLVTYHSRNLDYFTFRTSVEYFSTLALIPAVLLTAAKLVERFASGAFNTAPVVAVMAWMFYARPGISSLLQRPIELSVHSRFMILLALTAVVSLIHSRRRRWIPAAAALLLVTISIEGYVLRGPDQYGPPPTRATQGIPDYLSEGFDTTPDVYFLVYDSYPTERTLHTHGIQNAEQMSLLKNHGFVLYDGIYTVAPGSIGSISRVLDMAAVPTRGIGENNTVNAVLQREGYLTHLVLSSYFLRSAEALGADHTYPYPEIREGVKAVYTGLMVGEFKTELVFGDSERSEWLKEKRSILSAHTDRPKFLYSHSPYPGHSQNSGRCRANEGELFANRLELANEEMRQDIGTILESQRKSIIVVAGDHGPFLTGDCYLLASKDPSQVTVDELVDRYGAFLAVRWPDEVKVLGEMSVLQDLFFGIFSTLTGSPDVLANRPDWSTSGLGEAVPPGGIKNGVIQFGRSEGQRLFPDALTETEAGQN